VITTVYPSAARTRIPALRSQWYKQLEIRLDELTALPKGWDGYNAPPVPFACASFVANLLETISIDGLSPPQLVPGQNGSIQLEWHESGFDLEVEVLAPYKVNAKLYDIASDVEVEVELTNDFTELTRLVRALRDAHEPQAARA
jgi:hypothetical protein